MKDCLPLKPVYLSWSGCQYTVLRQQKESDLVFVEAQSLPAQEVDHVVDFLLIVVQAVQNGALILWKRKMKVPVTWARLHCTSEWLRK